MLAARYEAGDGVAASSSNAYGWFSLAAAAGLAEAQRAKARLAKTLAPEALSEAETRAARSRGAAAAAPHRGNRARIATVCLLASASPAATPPAASGAVSRGVIGEISAPARRSGYDAGPADGFLGEQTMQAIRRYQQDVGLAVDGAAGLALLNRLRAAAAGPPPAAQP